MAQPNRSRPSCSGASHTCRTSPVRVTGRDSQLTATRASPTGPGATGRRSHVSADELDGAYVVAALVLCSTWLTSNTKPSSSTSPGPLTPLTHGMPGVTWAVRRRGSRPSDSWGEVTPPGTATERPSWAAPVPSASRWKRSSMVASRSWAAASITGCGSTRGWGLVWRS
jgi:hypothetical protein